MSSCSAPEDVFPLFIEMHSAIKGCFFSNFLFVDEMHTAQDGWCDTGSSIKFPTATTSRPVEQWSDFQSNKSVKKRKYSKGVTSAAPTLEHSMQIVSTVSFNTLCLFLG